MKKGLFVLLFFIFVLYLAGCDTEHVHSPLVEWKSDETYHWHFCSDGCSELLEKAPHIWDEGVITKEATEEVEGEKNYTCTVCSATKTEVISIRNHVHEYSSEYSHDELFHWFESTCEHEGITQFKELHTYEFETLVPVSCTECEVLLGKCVCGETTIKVGKSAMGHDESTFISNNDATCKSDGTKSGQCSSCGEIITTTDIGSRYEHAWEEKTLEATYEAAGEVYLECSRAGCDGKETLEIIPQLLAVEEIVIAGEFYMTTNSSQKLTAKVSPDEATDKSLVWSSSDETVATVDATGKVITLKPGSVTIKAISHNNIEKMFKIVVLETCIDGAKDEFYDGVNPLSGKRTGPVVTHDSYVKLGENGIYIYQLVTDGKGITSTSHVEFYFTLGNTNVLSDSLSVHIYALNSNIRSYTYSSENNVVRNDKLAENYCQHSVEIIGEENGLGTYVVELFVDYSYFGLTEVPEFINAQIRTISGGGNPLSNTSTGTLDYKNIVNHCMFNKNGLVTLE